MARSLRNSDIKDEVVHTQSNGGARVGSFEDYMALLNADVSFRDGNGFVEVRDWTAESMKSDKGMITIVTSNKTYCFDSRTYFA